jgi:hypothetical protein
MEKELDSLDDVLEELINEHHKIAKNLDALKSQHEARTRKREIIEILYFLVGIGMLALYLANTIHKWG